MMKTPNTRRPASASALAAAAAVASSSPALLLLLPLLLSACGRGDAPETPKPVDPLANQPTAAVYKKELLEVPPEAVPLEVQTDTLENHEGLSSQRIKEGNGDPIRYDQIGRFHLVGTLANGVEYENTRRKDRPGMTGEPKIIRLRSGGDQTGLVLGLVGMKVGEVRSLVIPPDLAYGSKGSYMGLEPVPPGATITVWAEFMGIEDTLEMRRVKEGTGPAISLGQMGRFHYTGVLAKNGRQFDSSTGQAPRSFPLTEDRVMKGWLLGLPGMKVGEKRWLKIPHPLAYGEMGLPPRRGEPPPIIGPKADLIFEVELVGIEGS